MSRNDVPGAIASSLMMCWAKSGHSVSTSYEAKDVRRGKSEPVAFIFI